MPKATDRELQSRLRTHTAQGDFVVHEVQLEDLLLPALTSHASRIGKGELSAIAFAYRTRQAVLTDDQKARKLAGGPSLDIKTQTTPHLLGWLIYSRILLDSDYRAIVTEHTAMGGPLKPHFEKAYLMGFRALCQITPAATSTESPPSPDTGPSAPADEQRSFPPPQDP